jgi:NhaP-type Na+/H+ or K+/H+ antiporter
VQAPFTIACWFFVIILSKIAFHRVGWLKRVLPDSALLLIAGCIFGGILHFIIPDKEIYLQPNWFFLFLLPPIALDAGYFLPNKEFFQVETAAFQLQALSCS